MSAIADRVDIMLSITERWLVFNPLRSIFDYRDFWGEVNAYCAERMDAILQSGCYVPRWYHAPANELELLPGPGVVPGSTGYLRYALQIPAGSWIFAFWHHEIGVPGNPPPFWFQMTDGSLNHKFFMNPIPENYLATVSNNYPFLLDYPYPVVAPGIFQCEFWNQQPTTQRVSMTIGVAEVSPQLMEQVQKGGS